MWVLWELVLSFHQVGPGNWTQIIRVGRRHLPLVSHLTNTKCFSLDAYSSPFQNWWEFGNILITYRKEQRFREVWDYVRVYWKMSHCHISAPCLPSPIIFGLSPYFFAFLLIGICGGTGNLLIVFRGKVFIVVGTTGTIIINISIYSVRNPECKSNIQLDFLSSRWKSY